MRNERKRRRFSRSRVCRHSTLAVAVGMALAGRAEAGTLYWDGSGTGAVGNPPTTITGGSGQWDNSISANWWNGSGYELWSGPDGQDVAAFLGTAGTVTINSGETQNVNQLVFNTSGYVINGDSTTSLNLTGSSTITTNAGIATINAPINGSALNIAGAGTLAIYGTTSIGGPLTVPTGSTLVTNSLFSSSINLTGGTILFNVPSGSTVSNGSPALNVTAPSTIQFEQPGSGGSATYFFGAINLGANLSFDAQTYSGFYYYGMPTINLFGGINLLGNETLSVSGINANATTQVTTVNIPFGSLTGAYTLTKAGNGILNVPSGSNYSGLVVTGGSVVASDATGIPTSTLNLSGGTFTVSAPANTTVTTSVATTASGISGINIDQPGSAGGTTYNFGTLTLGAGTFSLKEIYPADYYYGQPTFNFGATTLTGNATVLESGGTTGNPGSMLTTTMGPISGAYVLTANTGNASLSIPAGGTGYAGLILAGGQVAVGGAGAVPTGTLNLSGGTLALGALPNTTLTDTTVITNVTTNSIVNVIQPIAAGQYGAGGAATYNLGALNLAANLSILQPNPGTFYYGEPKVNFGATTLGANVTLTESSGTAGGVLTTNIGPIVGPYTLTYNGTSLNILAGTGGNYAGLAANAGAVTINDSGGFPTAYLGLGGSSLSLLLPHATSGTVAATNVSANTTVTINQAGSAGAAMYNFGALTIGGDTLTITQSSANYYYGQPTVNFGAVTLNGNATLSETGGTSGGVIATTLGPITGAYTLTQTGNATMNIAAGTTGNYAGLAISGGPVTINDVGGFPTASLGLGGANLNLLIPSGKVATVASTNVSANTLISINQPGNTGAATYNFGTLTIGADTLSITLPTQANYYYGLPTVAFGATTLTGNANFNTSGSNGGFTLNPTIGSITGTGFSVSKSGTANLTLNGSNTYTGGTNVTGGTLILASANAFPASTSLNIASGAQVTVANHGGNATYVPVIGSLSNSGTIDVVNNALVIQNASIGTISTQVAQAYNSGTWTGTNASSGIISSSLAASSSAHLTAVGVATGFTSFEGSNVSSNSVLVKYTWYGDTNLDGKVDGTDYSRIDNGALNNLTGWYNGDFNYDGVVNGSDYTLIDNAFNTQGAQLAALVASPTAEISGAVGSAAVPEPATLGILALGAIGLLGRRRRPV